MTDTYHTISKDETIQYVGGCSHIAQARAEVSGLACSVLRNGELIFTYSPNPKKWMSPTVATL
jgi:hypothetical protein